MRTEERGAEPDSTVRRTENVSVFTEKPDACPAKLFVFAADRHVFAANLFVFADRWVL